MKRIAIVGCSGGGKSPLAIALGERLGLPMVHLDVLFWRPDWVESDLEAFRGRVAQTHAGEAWISEGNFITGMADLRFAGADTIIWIEQPRGLCLWRAVWRAVRDRRRGRGDLAPGCPERFDLPFYRYIWTWNTLTRPRMQAAIDTHAGDARLVRLWGDQEIAALLAGADDLGELP